MELTGRKKIASLKVSKFVFCNKCCWTEYVEKDEGGGGCEMELAWGRQQNRVILYFEKLKGNI